LPGGVLVIGIGADTRLLAHLPRKRGIVDRASVGGCLAHPGELEAGRG